MLADNSNRRVSIETGNEGKKTATKKKPGIRKAASKTTAEPAATDGESLVGKPCPKCGKGKIVKGKSAYGCSNFKECDYRIPFKL